MKRLFALLLALTLAVSLVGCGPRQRAEDGKLQVVCTVFPYYDFARQIGGDDVDVTLLVAAGKETHSFEPTPLDVITLSESDVFLYNGGESEAWVEDILSAAGENIAVTLPLMPQVSALAEEWAEGMEGGHDDHDHDHDSEDHSHDSDDIEYDEHVWTSPVLAKTLCQAICDALCQADPAHQEGYQSRLTDYLAQLDQLDAFAQILVDYNQKVNLTAITGGTTAAAGVRRPLSPAVLLQGVRAGLPGSLPRLRQRHGAVSRHAEIPH